MAVMSAFWHTRLRKWYHQFALNAQTGAKRAGACRILRSVVFGISRPSTALSNKDKGTRYVNFQSFYRRPARASRVNLCIRHYPGETLQRGRNLLPANLQVRPL